MKRDSQFQMVVPLTPVVKILLIANVSLWVGLVLILQNFFLNQPVIFEWFGLKPWSFLTQFFVWQPLTYMFIHSANVFHLVFNMLMLWWLGSELEVRWGSRFFLAFYLISGAGAAFIYLLGILIYYWITGVGEPLLQPVVGASGAIFGLIVAYGILFGERIIYFMMMFPMKARYFVMILAGIEVVSLLNSGSGGQVANLAHLGGLVSGYLFLLFWGRWQGRAQRNRSRKNGRRLKLVVDNERNQPRDQKGPRYWN